MYLHRNEIIQFDTILRNSEVGKSAYSRLFRIYNIMKHYWELYQIIARDFFKIRGV